MREYIQAFLNESEAMKDQLTAWRRDFHQHPEIGLDLPRTSGIVARALEKLDLHVETGIGGSGVVGLLEGGKPGPVVMVRFDMDALPITEETGAEYASKVDGAMHACGHDGHTAIGLGTAALLSRIRDKVPGTVKFVFQPGEEGFSGALAMISDGVLENPEPDMCLAMHLWNTEPVGWLGMTEGPVMAGADKVRIVIRGSGGHGSAPELAKDPVVAGSQIVCAAQSIVSRSIGPLESAVLSITSMHAGTTFNVIPPRMEMEGTVRTFKPEVRDVVIERLHTLVKDTASAMGCSAEVDVQPLSGPVYNQPDLIRNLQAMAHDLFPDCELETGSRVMGSEDMAEFQKRVPGAYLFVGSNNPEKGLDSPHHHPGFDFDEEVLPIGAALMSSAALRLLSKG